MLLFDVKNAKAVMSDFCLAAHSNVDEIFIIYL